MRIGGLLKFSLIDFPGRIAAVIFTQGCNFRCPFCHNRELVIPSCFQPALPEEEITSFLLKRRGTLSGVVVTGGEPTLHSDLPEFLARVKALGYAVKLDTNGSRPGMLRQVLERGLADFIAMDIKAPLERYHELAGVEVERGDIEESIRLICASGVDHLFRTTVVRPLLSDDDLLRIRAALPQPPRHILQDFVPRDTVLDPALTIAS